MGELDGRVALVTGGGRGIGRAISERLAAAGAAVAVNYRRDVEAATATVAAIEAAGGQARAYRASIDDEAADVAMVDAVVADFGFVDILVNNGRGGQPRPSGRRHRCRRAAARAGDTRRRSPHPLPPRGSVDAHTPRGDVVMISSVATRRMSGRGAPYNMGKAALEALAFTLAQEERAHGIHVNVVAPGLVETDMGVRLARSFTGDSGLTDLRPLDAAAPFGRVCQPADVADVVHYLCTNAAGYLTGQRIECDGGGESRNY